MANRYRFWAHGNCVQVEDWGALANITRSGWNTRVEQAVGTSNWFHLAVPTPTILNGDNATCQGLFLRGWIDNRSTIDEVRIYRAGDIQSLGVWNVSLSARDLRELYPLPDLECRRALTLSVHVNFDGPGNGEVQFHGVGGDFQEP